MTRLLVMDACGTDELPFARVATALGEARGWESRTINVHGYRGALPFSTADVQWWWGHAALSERGFISYEARVRSTTRGGHHYRRIATDDDVADIGAKLLVLAACYTGGVRRAYAADHTIVRDGDVSDRDAFLFSVSLLTALIDRRRLDPHAAFQATRACGHRGWRLLCRRCPSSK